MLKQRIDEDLKRAMLAGDQQQVATLRGLKSAILYAEVAKGAREKGLGNEEIIAIIAKEAKKRQESVDLYRQGGNSTRAETELAEKAIIENYLPQQLSDDELQKIVDAAIESSGAKSMQELGRVIATVKNQAQGAADGARIAQLVKERLLP
ncbi:MAG TPA: GatB/YqeY domain-containing protein [Candidatus Saccharimonadales bacterium]|nr:GatB/YqeY domain-containing protein [Candidatus Saccharimonadales bacterium]